MSKQKVLITGGTGLLGKTILETAPAGLELFATYHQRPPPETQKGRFHPLDVRLARSVKELFARIRPRTVIHTASIGEVDQAEREPETVGAVNLEGTRAVLEACAEIRSDLIFISSNAVFDGSHPPYREDSPLHAVNRYGQIKIEAERLVGSSGVPHLVVRPILMYGWPLEGGRENAVTRWLHALEKENPIEVAEDIISMPLWVDDCARTIWNGLLRTQRGTVHAAGADRVTLAQFAQEVCRTFGHNERLVTPVPSRRFVQLAPRPRDTSFDTGRMRREFGVEPAGIREGLTHMREIRAAVGRCAEAPGGASSSSSREGF